MIRHTEQELAAIAAELGKAYMAGYLDTVEGSHWAYPENAHLAEAYNMGRIRAEAEMRLEHQRIG